MSRESNHAAAVGFFRMANEAARDAILCRRQGHPCTCVFYVELQRAARLYRFMGREIAREGNL